MNMLIVILLISLASREIAATSYFDIAKYGGRPNSDITQALANAWREACASPTPSRVVVPKGLYRLKEASFKGPCKAAVEIQVQGTLQAPVDTSKLTNPEVWICFGYVDRLTLSGGGVFDGQGEVGWKNNDCHKNKKCKTQTISMRFDYVNNTLIQDITSLDSKNFHVNVLGSNNITFRRFTISAPGNSVNTDGIHVGRSTRINITDTKIATGDDCISIGDGTNQLTVTNVTCGPGHGIAIGSLGKYTKEEPVGEIRVKNCTIKGTTNGVRIKTWPHSPGSSTATNMHFEDIVMKNVSNPILIDQEYCPWNQCNKQISSKVQLSRVSFKRIRGSSNTPVAVKLLCSKSLPCDKVELSDINLTYNGGNGGVVTSECHNVKPTMTRVPKALACAVMA